MSRVILRTRCSQHARSSALISRYADVMWRHTLQVQAPIRHQTRWRNTESLKSLTPTLIPPFATSQFSSFSQWQSPSSLAVIKLYALLMGRTGASISVGVWRYGDYLWCCGGMHNGTDEASLSVKFSMLPLYFTPGVHNFTDKGLVSRRPI